MFLQVSRQLIYCLGGLAGPARVAFVITIVAGFLLGADGGKFLERIVLFEVTLEGLGAQRPGGGTDEALTSVSIDCESRKGYHTTLYHLSWKVY